MDIRVGSVVKAKGGELSYIVESISGNGLVGCRQSSPDGATLADTAPTTYRVEELETVRAVGEEEHRE